MITKRQLFNLPYEVEFNLISININYTYKLKKITKDGYVIYLIRCNDTWESLMIYEEYIEDERIDNNDIVIVKTLKLFISCGGLAVSSYDYSRVLSNLEILPRGSFKKFIELTK